MKRIYTLAELEALPTLSVAQCDDLKIETEDTRVWLSRLGVEDGEPYNNKVTIEKLVGGYKTVRRKQLLRTVWTAPHWVTNYTYEAK